MKLTTKEIDHIATLAHITLSDEEKEQYAEELSIIFDYVNQLSEVDTDGVKETAQVTGLEDVVREDIASEVDQDERQAIIEEFPDRVGNLLKVHAVFS